MILITARFKQASFPFRQLHDLQYKLLTHAKVAELADAPDLGSGAARRGGSSPPFRTNNLQRVCFLASSAVFNRRLFGLGSGVKKESLALMADHETSSGGASLSVGPDHVQAQVSEGTLAKLGQAISWLFPNRAAKVTITASLARHVSEKIASGSALDREELAFVSSVFDKERRFLSNREAVANKVMKLLPEVASQMDTLPPTGKEGVRETFMARAENIASETVEEEIRELFARVLAGEISRPGSFSPRTLEAVRTFDKELASMFEIARRLAFDHELILLDVDVNVPAIQALTPQVFIELQDAGLIDPVNTGFMLTFGQEEAESVMKYQDRLMSIRSFKSSGITSNRISVRRFTRVGREIASVLPLAPDEKYFIECRNLISRILGDRGEVTRKYASDLQWRPN
jgi:hypothetical protein